MNCLHCDALISFKDVVIDKTHYYCFESRVERPLYPHYGYVQVICNVIDPKYLDIDADQPEWCPKYK